MKNCDFNQKGVEDLSSAFKNFFITFSICLVIFAFLGFQARGWLTDLVLGIGKKDTPEDVSTPETSETSGSDVSVDNNQAPDLNDNYYNEKGDIFTAVVFCVDDSDRVVNCAFIDANAKTNRYIHCSIPTSTKITNEIGNPVPIDVAFGTMSHEAICDSVTALTGIQTDYCLRFTKSDMGAIASRITDASISLNSPVMITLPGAENENLPTEPEGTPENNQNTSTPDQSQPPAESTFVIENEGGRVSLTSEIHGKTKLQWLLESEKDAVGSNKNKLYAEISKELMAQFFAQQFATQSAAKFSEIISISDTNLTKAVAEKHVATIFSHKYYRYTYPSTWQSGVAALRDYDGRYNR